MAKKTTTTTTATTASAAFVLRPAKRAAHCAVCDVEFPKGTMMHFGHVPQCSSNRGICCDCWADSTMAEAMAVVTGVPTHKGRYHFNWEVEVFGGITPELRAAVTARNGRKSDDSQPRWYVVGGLILSPTLRNGKAGGRLTKIGELAPKGKFTLYITTACGAHVGEITHEWSARDPLGRFLKKTEREPRSKMMGQIESIIAQYEGRER